ncbi:MFS transporter [Pelosinus fermentans]|uniref:Phosphotransferase system EIIB/cysteine, phosphorylation site n=1 Tax=Pelosinus fermentans JBW45 TaxID=1192197 RepID=I9NSV0_9FIRM|nr:MFS transporter [Pelosinus fermentans]AJQ26354.1 Phosphotransferase system EIIB/cysteine, phosphorylation site [Pelosinus fermentans JBW45]
MTIGNRKITIPIGIGYGLTDLMGGGAFSIIAAWLLFFYTTYAGLTPVEAASIVAIARIVDAIVSLFIGSVTDNFFKNSLGKRFGRRRFFLLIGAPLMAVYAMLWVTGMSYWYYLGCYLAFEIIAAIVLIPWETLPSEMTTDFNERTILSTSRMFISATGVFLSTFVPALLIRFFGESNAYAYTLNGTIFAVLFAICIFISYKVTWERELTDTMKAELLQADRPKSFGERWQDLVVIMHDYGSTLKVRAFRQHLLIYICSFTGKDVYNTVFVFFAVYCLNIPSANAADVLSLSIIGIPTTIAAGLLLVKIGPSNLYKISYTTMLVTLAGFFAVYLYNPSSKLVILYALSFFYQIGRQILEFTPWNVFPFIPDVDELICQKRREGLFAAVMTFSRKTTVGIATLVVGLVLQEGGFVKGQLQQSPEAIYTISYTLLIGTGGLLIIALILACSFKLDKKTHAILIHEVNRLKAGEAKADVTAEARAVCENLTGYKYEELWPHQTAARDPWADELVLAKEIIANVGGSYNIDYYTYCVTRLRIKLTDHEAANREVLTNLDGVKGITIVGQELQIVLGQKVNAAYEALQKILGNKKQWKRRL